jgi:hypothetical protein
MTLTPRLVLALVFAMRTSAATQGEPAATVVTSPVRLFNGRDLTGFYSWLLDSKYSDPRGVFTVTNGQLRISGDGLGYLATRAAYRDYRLWIEFRWGHTNWPWGERVGKARDSGLFLHSIGPDGNSHDGGGAFRAAIECNLFQGAVGDLLLIRGTAADGAVLAPRLQTTIAAEPDNDRWPYWDPAGRSWSVSHWGRLNWAHKSRAWQDRLDFRGERDVESPWHSWTRVECVCAGDRIRVLVNGTLVNAATDVWPQAGQILLQCEGSEIFFRRLELLPLAAEDRAPSGPVISP